MRLRPVALGAVVCACCAGTTAFAQQLPAVTPERQIHGSFSLQSVYDSNFARSSSTLAAQRGIDKEEYTLRPQVDVNVVQPLGRQLVFLTGSAGYDFHRNNPRLDRPRADMQGGFVSTLGMCQASAFGNYRASLSDLGTVDNPGVKNLLQGYSTAVGAQCGRPRGFNGSVTAQRAEAKNSATSQKEADSTTETLLASLGYANPTVGRVGLVFSYANSEFPNRIIPGRPVGDGFYSQSYGLTVERPFGRRLLVRGTVGRTLTKREFAPAGVDQKFTSTTYSAQATYKFGNRLNFELQGDRAVQPTSRAGKLYDVNTALEARGRYNFGTRYTFSAGHRIEDIDSNVDTNATSQVVSNSRTHSTYASLRYKQSRLASLTLDVRYDDRNTNLPDFNYTSTRVGLSAQIGF